jgi:PAS domain S-box-containing protein
VRFWLPGLLLLLTVGCGAILYFYEAGVYEARFDAEFQKDELSRAARVQAEIERWVQRNDLDMAQSVLAEQSMAPELRGISFLDDADKVLASSRREYLRRPFEIGQMGMAGVDPGRLHDVVAEVRRTQQGASFFTDDRNGLIVCFPTALPMKPGTLELRNGGLLLMGYDFAIQKEASLQHVRAEFLSYFVGLSIIALILAVCLHFLITRRLERLRGAMADFAAGKPVAAGPARPGDEISELVDGFNEMAATIGAEMQLRQRTERELRETVQEVQALYDCAPCGYHSLDANGVFLRINDTELQWLGYSREEVVGRKRFTDFLPKRMREEIEGEFEQFKKRGWVRNLEVEMVGRDGAHRSMLVSATALRDEAGNYVMSRSTVTDISERKVVENLLRFIAQLGWTAPRAESFLASLANYLGEILHVDYVVIDKLALEPGVAETVALFVKGNIVPNMRYTLHGTPCENVVGRGLCYYPRGVQGLFPEDELLRDMEVESYVGIPLWDSSGVCIGLIAVMDAKPLRDEDVIRQLLQVAAISAAAALERERSDLLLQQREREFGTLANNIPDMVARYDTDLKCVFVNRAWEEELGQASERLVSELSGTFQRVLSEGVSEKVELSWVNARGENRVHEHLVVPEYDHEGLVVSALAVARDITDRKRAEEGVRKLNEELDLRVKERTAQLEAANKELEAFSYSVSHDLRAPLRSIDGFSKALLEDYADKLDEEGKEDLHSVRRASQRMAQLIDDILRLSRITRAQLRIAPTDLSALAAVVADDLKQLEPKRRVEFAIEPGCKALADENLMRVVLENLLGNAWKFTSKREGARIEFGRTMRDGAPAFYVRDNGAGFDMQYAEKLFGAFQRLHTTSEFPGTGIGLASVQRVIRRHGGEVWIEGKLDEGATVFFTIPQQETSTS